MPPFLNEAAPLDHYSYNLTRLALKDAAPSFADQDAVNRVFEVLQRPHKSNPLILTTVATRRWAILTEVARRMARGDAPTPFSKGQVIGLDYEALLSNLPNDDLPRQELIERKLAPFLEKLAQATPDSHGEMALLDDLLRWPSLEEWIAPTMVLERLQMIFMAIKRSPDPLLLFVDHFHRLVGGEYQRFPIDAATLLKPTLARREIQLIGACTLKQYRQHIKRDAAIDRRWQAICLPEADDL